MNRCLTEGRQAFSERLDEIQAGAECERLAGHLSALADGEATADDIGLLRPHLRTCLACRTRLREFRAAPARVAASAAALAGGGTAVENLATPDRRPDRIPADLRRAAQEIRAPEPPAAEPPASAAEPSPSPPAPEPAPAPPPPDPAAEFDPVAAQAPTAPGATASAPADAAFGPGASQSSAAAGSGGGEFAP